MKIIDPGHSYLIDSYDGAKPQKIVFMKREGPGYPGNKGHYGGTNLQEILRVAIDRFQYLDQQIPCYANTRNINMLRWVLALLEDRAAERHGSKANWQVFDTIEKELVCGICGHLLSSPIHKNCEEKCEKEAEKQKAGHGKEK